MGFDLLKETAEAGSIGITGHIKPDGDCIGSCLALLMYLRKAYPDKRIELFLEKPAPGFRNIPGRELIDSAFPDREAFDVFIVADTNKERTGDAEKYFDAAKKTLNIDHHVSNKDGCAMLNHVEPETAAAAEVIYKMMKEEYIDRDIAYLLCMGIAHDTGGFHFSNTTAETHRIAARLLEYGFDYAGMMDETFYFKTYKQNRLIAEVVLGSQLHLNGKLISGTLTLERMHKLGVTKDDTDGIVNQLRITEGVECAMFVYEKKAGVFKASLRASTDNINVAKLAEHFGGGGHVRASGCEREGVTIEEFVEELVKEAALQLDV
ncbi:MAG: bifunctional oligoribonuclease/PAP phosphatase NrnA [Lachnospiraceae bacterium]|nr:bifunctional oligoribonuclease/PAP phosphatase NrnA [Lachnospiraceae bacterium]